MYNPLMTVVLLKGRWILAEIAKITNGLTSDPNGVGFLEPGVHFMSLNSPDGADALLNKLYYYYYYYSHYYYYY